MESRDFPVLGEVFYIVHNATGKCLEPQKADTPYKSSLRMSAIEPNNDVQLWQIEEMEPGRYEIVHARSCLLLDQQNRQPYLNYKKHGKNTQLWYIERPSPVQDHLFIRRSSNSIDALIFCKEIFVGLLDPTNDLFQFRFVLTKNDFFDRSCMISSVHSGKFIDIQWACIHKGTYIIQWSKHKRLNQRWHLIRTGNSFAIQSLLTGMLLDIKGQKKSPGGYIVQWTNNHKSNQMWRLEKQTDGSYLISSVMSPELVLGVKNKDLKDQGYLMTCLKSDPYYWNIEGFIPDLFPN